MPDVGSNQLRAANSSGNFVSGIPMGKDGTTGGPNNDGWKYGIAVYVHNGTEWVEVWNARPQVVSSSMATTSTGLTFSGTADPNNFSTTAKFEYKEVGAGSYSNSGTTSTGMGNGTDSAVSYTVTATVADTWKNWESRASATNVAGTGTGSTLTLDCRQHDNSGSGWGTSDSSNASTCDGCGTVTTRTYTKSSCQSYTRTITTCGAWGGVSDEMFPSGCYGPLINGTASYAAYSLWGWIYYTDSGCTNVPVGCGDGLPGPVGVTRCTSSGAYRVEGGDTCVYPSCC